MSASAAGNSRPAEQVSSCCFAASLGQGIESWRFFVCPRSRGCVPAGASSRHFCGCACVSRRVMLRCDGAMFPAIRAMAGRVLRRAAFPSRARLPWTIPGVSNLSSARRIIEDEMWVGCGFRAVTGPSTYATHRNAGDVAVSECSTKPCSLRLTRVVLPEYGDPGPAPSRRGGVQIPARRQGFSQRRSHGCGPASGEVAGLRGPAGGSPLAGAGGLRPGGPGDINVADPRAPDWEVLVRRPDPEPRPRAEARRKTCIADRQTRGVPKRRHRSGAI